MQQTPGTFFYQILLHKGLLDHKLLHQELFHQGLFHQGLLHQVLLHQGVLHQVQILLHQGFLHASRNTWTPPAVPYLGVFDRFRKCFAALDMVGGKRKLIEIHVLRTQHFLQDPLTVKDFTVKSKFILSSFGQIMAPK